MATIFFVAGRPVPQGSLMAVRNRVIHVNSAKLMDWRKRIALHAKQEGLIPNERAHVIHLDFVFLKPKSSKRELCTVRPDLDKLVRAVLDALTGVAYFDDSQVIDIKAQKRYTDEPDKEGLYVKSYYYENA